MPAHSVAVVIDTAGENPGVSARMARDAVAAEMVKRGFQVADQASATLLVTLANRPDVVEARAADGVVVAPEKGRRVFQSCDDRIHRLTLAMLDANGEVSRAWAEESHCKGTLEQSLKPLAQNAVATLTGAQPTGTQLRSGRD